MLSDLPGSQRASFLGAISLCFVVIFVYARDLGSRIIHFLLERNDTFITLMAFECFGNGLFSVLCQLLTVENIPWRLV